MNARFWAYVNDGQVKITLRPMQTASWSKRWAHEEGWSAEGETWTHWRDHIERTVWTDGRDCDGRMSTETVLRCDLAHLMDDERPDREPYPDWQRIESSQRDYQAEAAGY
jgi:hypothetical protein